MIPSAVAASMICRCMSGSAMGVPAAEVMLGFSSDIASEYASTMAWGVSSVGESCATMR